MGIWIFMLIINLPMPLMMIVFGKVFVNNTPKEINRLYGYRTARSMASKEAWDFAHRYMGKLWFKMGWGGLILSLAAMLLCIGQDYNTISICGGIICAAQVVLVILPIFPTEKALKTTFGA